MARLRKRRRLRSAARHGRVVRQDIEDDAVTRIDGEGGSDLRFEVAVLQVKHRRA